MARPLPPVLDETLTAALGRTRREDPVLERTGGPSGNARLTAWLGLVLFALFVAELLTLVDIRGLITWHLALGLVLIPPVLAKVASTGWRMVRYYLRSPAYVQSGPPPTLLRLLGPLVVLGTLAVLASGGLLIALGPGATFRPWFSVLGHDVSPLTLHQASFILWAVVTGLHVLARLLPALHHALEPLPLPGRGGRGVVLLVTAVAAAVTAVTVVGLAGAWTSGNLGQFHVGHESR